jgi:hypothetical protein
MGEEVGLMSILPAKPSSARLRAMLEEMVVNDLLGPAGGNDQELIERTVRDRPAARDPRLKEAVDRALSD